MAYLKIAEGCSNKCTYCAIPYIRGKFVSRKIEDIVKEAENRIISMIDEHEITRKAYEQKAQIIETANEMSREISKGTKDYADNLLERIEVVLEEALKTVQNNRKELK